MTESNRPRTLRALTLIVGGAIVGALVVAAVTAVVTSVRPATPSASPAPTEQTDQTRFTRPDDWSDYRPAVHLTPAGQWMNDPQRPFLLDGVWHYYYLYNADYPEGNGTEWYHTTSTDLVHWEDHGVAIEKYENGLGDIETGSAVVDVDNTAGFGKGAVVAVMTQQHEGVQRQSLFVSTDGGYRFESYDANPVMENPGEQHWRDPKIVWDDDSSEWLMVLAEGHKIGFYTSPDLKHWTYRSGFERDDLGLLECPDVFRMSIDGDPSNTKWVLAAGANGSAYGTTTGTVYWTGEWDGQRFTADRDEPRWLDSGADFYAAVTWNDSSLSESARLESRYAIGWLNNWAYAAELPTVDWSGGLDSIVRRIELQTVDGEPRLVSQPVDALDELGGDPEIRSDIEVTDVSPAPLPQPTTDAYRLRVELAAPAEGGADEVRFRLKEGGGSFATVGYDFSNAVAFIARDTDAAAAAMPPVYREVRSVPAVRRDGVVTLDVVVDTASIEVFVNDGEAVLSSLVFGEPGANGLSVETVGGTTELRSVRVTPLAVAPIQRFQGDPPR